MPRTSNLRFTSPIFDHSQGFLTAASRGRTSASAARTAPPHLGLPGLSRRALGRRKPLHRVTGDQAIYTGAMSIYDPPLHSLDGEPASLGDYRGKALLVVNVASKCGLTPQYEGLERLQKTYGDKGFTVLGFPCNQFGEQEPGSSEEIATFCSATYGVTFPMFEKVEVNGEGRHPVYEELRRSPTPTARPGTSSGTSRSSSSRPPVRSSSASGRWWTPRLPR